VDFLEELMSRNPSMREHLAARMKQYDAMKADSLSDLQDNCRFLGIDCDNNAREYSMDIASAVKHAKACEHCSIPIEESEKCKYVNAYYQAESVFGKLVQDCKKAAVLMSQRRFKRILANSGVGDRFKNRTFSTFEPSKETEMAFNACMNFCDTFKPSSKGLFLMGSYGCGKTHLAASIIHKMAEKGVPGLFVVVPDLLYKIRAGFGKEENESEQVIEAAKTAKILALDDLGAEKATEWVIEQLFLIVNYRYEHLLPTIVTTNCQGKELENHIGRRMLSRIAEMTVPIVIKAADYRMKKFA